MGVYVDEIKDYSGMVAEAAQKHGSHWCHMFADTPEELHALALKIGLRRDWCSDHTQPHSRRLHYDLTPGMRIKAVKNGAIPVKRWSSDGNGSLKVKKKQQTLFDDLGQLPD